MSDESTAPSDWPSEWLRGVLGVCVLRVLSDGPTYGYAIGTALADGGLGTLKGGTLYPLLARLETEGLVVSTWQAGEGGPGRKVFSVTDKGQDELARRADLWRAFVTVTQRYLDTHGTLGTLGTRDTLDTLDTLDTQAEAGRPAAVPVSFVQPSSTPLEA